MKMTCIVLALFMFLAVEPSAYAQWLKNGKPFDSGYAKTNGKFGARIVFVANNDELYKEWEAPTAGVSIHEVTKIARNKPLSSFVIFSNATSNKNDMANVTARYIVTNPFGGIVQETPEMEVWKNKPTPKEGDLQLSAGFMQVVLNNTSQLGIYTVNVIVYDVVADLRIELERQFELVDK